MGRRIRRVPPNWKHPEQPMGPRDYQYSINSRGMIFKSLYDGYEKDAEEWRKGFLDWESGKRPDDCEEKYYWEFAGRCPEKDDYVDYEGVEPTWYQIYENVSEGSPVTPPFGTQAELISYLVNYGDAWDQRSGTGPWTLAAATRMVDSGYAPSMIISAGKISEPRTMENI